MIGMNLLDFYTIFHACENKKVIIFGSGIKAERFIEKIRLFGIEPVCCIDFYEDIKAGVCAGIPVLEYYEILKEDNVYILLTEVKGQNRQVRALVGMGYEYLKDFNFMAGASKQGKLTASSPVDPILGWGVSKKETSIDGAKIYGDIDNAQYKIAIVGGSVAESCYYSWKTWPEILYEKLIEKGENVAIISGGVIGYTSSKVLLKFVRDILPYKPDVLIDYNVILNDVGYGLMNDTPYITGYQRKMMSRVNKKINDIYREQLVVECVWGNQRKKDAVKVLSDNVRTLRAICQEFDINYLCILHPNMYTKKLCSYKEKELYQVCSKHHIDNSAIFYERFEEEIRLHNMDYIIDGRNWMDEYVDIYYDYCHMYEDGNSVIADRVLNLLEK